MAKSLHAYCPRCRSYAPVDSFAGGTTYLPHDTMHAVSCPNSGQSCYYIVRDHFAGAPIVARDRGECSK